MLIPSATKCGYEVAKDGDGIYLNRPSSKTRRGRVGKEKAQTLTTSCNQGIVIGSTQKNAYVGTLEETSPTLTTAMGSGGGHIPMIGKELRIRKLTPLECWRLMGIDDDYFHRATVVNSNSQLYRQAGNGICIPVMEAIFKNMVEI